MIIIIIIIIIIILDTDVFELELLFRCYIFGSVCVHFVSLS
jgi:hypothetical protein